MRCKIQGNRLRRTSRRRGSDFPSILRRGVVGVVLSLAFCMPLVVARQLSTSTKRCSRWTHHRWPMVPPYSAKGGSTTLSLAYLLSVCFDFPVFLRRHGGKTGRGVLANFIEASIPNESGAPFCCMFSCSWMLPSSMLNERVFRFDGATTMHATMQNKQRLQSQ